MCCNNILLRNHIKIKLRVYMCDNFKMSRMYTFNSIKTEFDYFQLNFPNADIAHAYNAF